MFELQRVHFAYTPEKHVFHGLDLNLGKNENVLVTGDNGSGKSTLLKLLIGILQPQQGTVLISGKVIKEISAQHGRNCFYLSQQASEQILGYNPESDLRIWAMAGLDVSSITDHPLLQSVSEDIMHTPFRELSSGTLQAYLLTLALLAESRWMLLDEPLKSLDKDKRRIFLEALSTRRGMLIVSHEPEPFTPLMSRHLEIRAGSLHEV
ncbi:MAG TPA: ATP-binding cassette domain-containing protein [Candidatus Cloacimonadota bacterium]|nr:ATP-binding cassette domain-containing protein [Candidatus Cloacimonadota bacterium]